MKKNTILQLIIIYVGINAVYYGFNYIIQNVAYYFSVTTGNTPFVLKLIAGYMLICLLGIVVVFRSGKLSNYIADRSGLDDSLTIYSKPQQLLSILIVVVGLSQLFTRLPYLANTVIGFFSNYTPERGTGLDINESLAFNFFTVLFPCLMIVFCRQLTTYFSRNILLDEEDIVAHQDTVEIETTDGQSHTNAGV